MERKSERGEGKSETECECVKKRGSERKKSKKEGHRNIVREKE